jgi:hypothetical protein
MTAMAINQKLGTGVRRQASETDFEGPPCKRFQRRDRSWQWLEWLVLPGALLFVVLGLGLDGYFFPARLPATTSVKLKGKLDAAAPPGPNRQRSHLFTERLCEPFLA